MYGNSSCRRTEWIHSIFRTICCTVSFYFFLRFHYCVWTFDSVVFRERWSILSIFTESTRPTINGDCFCFIFLNNTHFFACCMHSLTGLFVDILLWVSWILFYLSLYFKSYHSMNMVDTFNVNRPFHRGEKDAKNEFKVTQTLL